MIPFSLQFLSFSSSGLSSNSPAIQTTRTSSVKSSYQHSRRTIWSNLRRPGKQQLAPLPGRRLARDAAHPRTHQAAFRHRTSICFFYLGDLLLSLLLITDFLNIIGRRRRPPPLSSPLVLPTTNHDGAINSSLSRKARRSSSPSAR